MRKRPKSRLRSTTPIGGWHSIRVRDNGHGIPPQEAEELFMHLGGSWKRNENKSKSGKRRLHGEEGKGRFRALALGRVATWLVTAPDERTQLVRYSITVIKDRAKEFKVTSALPVNGDAKAGVEVTISEPYKQWRLENPTILQELNEIYAIYMMEYPGVHISLVGTNLDPAKQIERRKTFTLAFNTQWKPEALPRRNRNSRMEDRDRKNAVPLQRRQISAPSIYPRNSRPRIQLLSVPPIPLRLSVA
jgi:hypothetical protein